MMILGSSISHSEQELYKRSKGWGAYELHAEAMYKLFKKEYEPKIWILIWDSYARPTNPLEISMSIEFGDSPLVRATVAKDQTIMMQLVDLQYTDSKQEAQNKISRQRALSLLEVEHHAISPDQCEGMSDILEEFNQIGVDLPVFRTKECKLNKQGHCLEELTITLHPRIYDIEVAYINKTLKMHYEGDYDSLSNWAEEIRGVVMRCIKSA